MNIDDSVHSDATETSEHRPMLSRRTLLKAGWTAPVILTVAPAVAFAASGHTQPTTQSAGGTTGTQVTPTQTVDNTTATRSPGTGTSGSPGTDTSGSTSPASANTAANPKVLPEQQSRGPQPARINRGFTG